MKASGVPAGVTRSLAGDGGSVRVVTDISRQAEDASVRATTAVAVALAERARSSCRRPATTRLA